MNLWKAITANMATRNDWVFHTIVKRDKGESQLIRRYGRRKLKQQLREGKE